MISLKDWLHVGDMNETHAGMRFHADMSFMSPTCNRPLKSGKLQDDFLTTLGEENLAETKFGGIGGGNLIWRMDKNVNFGRNLIWRIYLNGTSFRWY